MLLIVPQWGSSQQNIVSCRAGHDKDFWFITRKKFRLDEGIHKHYNTLLFALEKKTKVKWLGSWERASSYINTVAQYYNLGIYIVFYWTKTIAAVPIQVQVICEAIRQWMTVQSYKRLMSDGLRKVIFVLTCPVVMNADLCTLSGISSCVKEKL